MLKQKEAILRLLRDNDPDTVRLVKQQLADGDSFGVPELRELLDADDARVTAHVSEVLGKIQMRRARSDFGDYCRDFSQRDNMEDAAWRLARAMMPQIDPETYRTQLDEWAREVRGLVNRAMTPQDQVGAFSRYLFERLRFRGNTKDYYSPENSILPRVIDSRLGIPLSLSMVALMVARRFGFPLEGINLPGHFILAHKGIHLDPFHGGRILGSGDIQAILSRQGIHAPGTSLQPVPDRIIVLRMISNLHFVFTQREDEPMVELISGWLAAFSRH